MDNGALYTVLCYSSKAVLVTIKELPLDTLTYSQA